MSRPSLPYWHADAFSAQPFGGNQAAVMLLQEWLDDDALLAIAEENQFAETAFLVADASGAADYELRWFTPTLEVTLCGHATLASGHVVLTREPQRESVSFRTRKSGILEVRRAAAGYELALPAIAVKEEASADLLAGLGQPPVEAMTNDSGYVIARYENEAEIRALAPDMAALAAFGDTMFIITSTSENSDIVSRVFVPGAGIPEDSATGSAHSALTTFWAPRLGRDSFSAHQASARGADFACRLDGDRVWLGGPCATVVEGRFYLTG